MKRVARALVLLACGLAPYAALAQPSTEKDKCVAAFEGGQLARKADKLREARALFETCTNACPAALARDCKGWLDELDVPVSASGSASVPPPAPLAPPAVSAPPSSPSASATAPAPAAAPAPSVPDRTPHVVLASVGVVAGITGAVLGIKGTVDRDQLRATCAPNCSNGDVTAVRTLWISGAILGGLGALSLGAAIVLWPSAPARVSVGVGPSARDLSLGLAVDL
jgi:hypothetical protein